MAQSSPHFGRIRSSDSYWIALVSIEVLIAKRLKPSGRRGDQNTVRFGSGAGPEVVQRVQHAERALGDQRAAVLAHAADDFGHPDRIAREQLVVFRRAQEAHDAPLDDEVVDDLLRLRLGQRAFAQVALEVDVPERRQAPGRHRRAVLLLDRGEVAEVGPLHRLARVARPARRCRSRSSTPSPSAPCSERICSASSSRRRITSSVEWRSSSSCLLALPCRRSGSRRRTAPRGGSRR